MTTKLWRPINLLDGRRIGTVAEAAAVMEDLPPARQLKPVWQKTCEMLLQAKESGDANDLQHATAQLRRALLVEGWVE